jgi:hypothetical protein
MKLAIEIWDKHIDVFMHFDLVCHNGSSLEDETRSNALFNAIVTLEQMLKVANPINKLRINEAIDYLKGSKYYSDVNQSNTY